MWERNIFRQGENICSFTAKHFKYFPLLVTTKLWGTHLLDVCKSWWELSKCFIHFLFRTCETNLPESFTEPCCLEKRPTRQALARCSANSQVWRLDAVDSALLLRSKALSGEIKAVFLTDLHNHGRRFYWSQAVIVRLDATWNLQLIQLSKLGLKWVQIWKKTQLFESPIKSNCPCKAHEVFFVFRVNACGSRLMPKSGLFSFYVIVWAQTWSQIRLLEL